MSCICDSQFFATEIYNFCPQCGKPCEVIQKFLNEIPTEKHKALINFFRTPYHNIVHVTITITGEIASRFKNFSEQEQRKFCVFYAREIRAQLLRRSQ